MDLDKAISTHDDALRIPDGHPAKPNHLNNLGGLLLHRFECGGNVADIDKSVAVRKDAVYLTPDGQPDKPSRLSNLGNSLLRRFERLGNVIDVEESLSVHDDAVRLTPDGDPDKPAHLNNLGNSLLAHFERFRNVVDVNRAITAFEDAVRLTPDGHSKKTGRLSNLANSLIRRFEHLRNMPDIDRSIAVHEDAVRLTPDGHPDKPSLLNNLSGSLLTRFECLRNVTDADRSIAVCEDAVLLTPDNHTDKPRILSNIGKSCMRRFGRLGNVSDIDKSISAHYDVVRLTPDGHPDMPGHLNSLGDSLLARFNRLGAMSDMDKSISVHEAAVRLTPDKHAGRPGRLNNLGVSLLARFERLGNLPDVTKSISAHDDAVQVTPDGHPDKPILLSNLGNSFLRRFERLRNVFDIDKSILAHDEAVQLTLDGLPNKPALLNNLGGSLLARFEHLKNVIDIDKSISNREHALRLTPDGHPDKPGLFSNLGNSLLARFECLGDVVDLNSSTVWFSCAARSSAGPPAVRFRAAVRWANCCLKTRGSSLDAYRCALSLLPRVAWLGLPLADRHKELAQIGDVVRDAAAAAIESGDCQTALEWLEQGRSIVWGQLLDLRSPVDALRERDPAVATRLEQTSKDLDRASIRDKLVDFGGRLSLEEAARHHRQLALDWDELVECARAVPGFEDFLRPKRMSHFRNAAQSGPVVVINIQEIRCDALILLANQKDVMHVSLDGFSHTRALKLHNSMDDLLSACGFRTRSDLRHPVRDDSLDEDGKFKEILFELWLHVVKPVLEGLALPVSRTDDPPRLWWCPTGPLTFLPLHAAGIYNTNEPGSKITDFVASSYTPTLTALLNTPRRTSANGFQLLAITQPSDLPNTTRELNLIQGRAGDLQIRSLNGAEATVERVVQKMMECSWIHLACHGTQNTTDPTKSALLLHDGRLGLLEIIRTPLPHAEFAFLSACQTATGDRHLSEEAVHLAAGMLLAGYRSVVATTWSIKDYDAPLVADEVYSYLFKDRQPDYTRAAHALHHAVRRLRESERVSFRSWVPFIHVGM